jgi:hypothetical protein
MSCFMCCLKCFGCCVKSQMSELDKKKVHDLLHAPIVITKIENTPTKKPVESTTGSEKAVTTQSNNK